MKRKTYSWIFITIVVIFIGGIFLLITNLTTTNYGKINMRFAIMFKINKYLNPDSIQEKSISDIRKTLDQDVVRWSSKPIPFSNIKNTDLSISSTKISVRIYTPEKGNNFPIIIYSHGGFWIVGNLDTHDNVCRKLSKNTNAIVISVNYRLAPESPFPCGIDDVYNTVQWVYKNAKSINGDPKHIAVVGDSAGGNISTVAALMARDKNEPYITSQVLIYPSTNIFKLNSKSWNDLSSYFNVSKEDMEKYIKLYVPKKEDRKSPYVSPLLAEDLKKLPPALIIIAEIDPLRDEGEAYAERLKAAGNEVVISKYKGVPHGFLTMDSILKESNEAIDEISKYLQKNLY